MARLPTPGGDSNAWGQVLNDFLVVEHNADGTLKLRTDGTFYQKPAGGIPKSDLAASVQTSLTTADSRDAAKLQGTTVNNGAPSDGQVLLYDAGSTSWVPGTISSTTISDATASTKGILRLTGDLGGTADTPTVPALGSKVGTARAINTSTGLTGGGDLSADRTLSVVNDTTTQKVRVSKGGTLQGTRQEVNFIQGSNVTLTTADDAGNNRVNITIAGAAPGSSTLAADTDVAISSPADKQVLTYNSSSTKWQNQAPAVASVNTQTGVVSLAASDVNADPVGSADAVAANATAFIRYNTGSSSYPTRGSVTSDTNRTVIWIGPVAPSIGGSGAINDVDVWWKTP